MTTNLMVFIAGDNDLDTFGSTDIEEMMSVADTGDNLTILVQQDQSKDARDSGTKRYVIRNGQKESIEHLGETNTGDSNTLTEFLKWGMENYEAERNIAVLWNHGGGTRDELFPGYENNETNATMRSVAKVNPTLGNQPSIFSEELRLKRVAELMEEYEVEQGKPTRSIETAEAKSILFDDDAKDFLDNLELKQVFVDLGKKLDIIGFDACLMNMLEVAYQLRDHTEVVVGSEELEPGKGWDYAALVTFLVENPNASNEEIGKAIVDGFVASYANEAELKVTLSALRTEALDNFACLLNNFAHTILRKEERIRSRFLPIVDEAQTFDYQNNEQIYRDLKHFVLLTKESYDDEEITEVADALLAGLEKVVFYNLTNNFEHAYGLSVYLPLMPNMSGFAINVFSALDINAENQAPYWLKLFKQIGNIDNEPNTLVGAEPLEACVETPIVMDEVVVDEQSETSVIKDDYAGMYLITSFIKQGKRDEFAVKQMQGLLNILGQELIVDGDFGARSTKAIKEFQAEQGLVADGLVGEQTWYRLYAAAGTKARAKEGYELISFASDNRALVILAQSLFYLLDRKTAVTAVYDETMDENVTRFQTINGLEVNAQLDEPTWEKLFDRVAIEIESIDSMLLKDDFITQKALENDLSPAAVKAVIKVESRGRGFDRKKNLVILFEGHIFWKELVKIGLDPSSMVEGNEDIIYKKPDYKYYNRPQYPRLEKAEAIDEVAALNSASYGMFQVMGFNHKLAGFEDVLTMVNSLSESEKNQLEAFISFLRNTACYEDLKAKDWASFARHYNGSMYARNQYDVKLEKAYNNSKLTKGIATPMDEETYTSMYALELEKAFLELEE